jgi:hypothetical protein
MATLPRTSALPLNTRHDFRTDIRPERATRTPIVEAQGGSPLTVTLNWVHDLLVDSLANEAVVSDGLDVQKTSIGLKADLPKRGEILQSFADSEVTGIVDGGFSTQGAV